MISSVPFPSSKLLTGKGATPKSAEMKLKFPPATEPLPHLVIAETLVALSCRVIDLDKFDMWKLRSEAQSQGIETGACNNDTLTSFSKRFKAALFDPMLAVPVVRDDAWLHESF